MNSNQKLSIAEMEEIVRKCEKINAHLLKCYKISETIVWSQKTILERLKCEVIDSDCASTLILKENYNLYKNIMIEFNILYKEINRLLIPDIAVQKGMEVINSDCLNVVDAEFFENSLYVKMPRIPKKNFIKFNFYENEIRQKLEELWSSIVTFPHNSEKIIRIIHIFSSQFNQRFIPDNDNYDFKRAVDIITDYIGGGDGGLSTSFLLESTINDEVDEGSYIIVSPVYDSIPSSSVAINKLKQFFPHKIT